MKIFEKHINLQRLLLHLLFWLMFFTVLIVVAGPHALNKNFLLIDVPVTLVYCYSVSYLLIPLMVRKRRFIVLVFLIALVSIGFSYLRLLNYDYLYYSIFSPVKLSETGEIPLSLVILNAKDFSFSLFIFLAVKYTVTWYRENRKTLMKERDYMESEYSLIQTQIDPHFLFNTLNNIYSLSVTEPPATQFAIKKMSGLLDFIINQSSFQEISLKKEIKLIEDYVDLERLRYGDRLNFKTDIAPDLPDVYIPPLLLFPLVENCFKHGSAVDPGNPWIKISLKPTQNGFKFTAANSKKRHASDQDEKIVLSERLDRIRRKLKLNLENNYHFQSTDLGNEFRVELEITVYGSST